MPLSLVLSGSDMRLLSAIYIYHYLAAEQVCRLLYRPGSLVYARVRLKRLTDGKFLHRLRLPHTKSGNTPFVYTLGRKGIAAMTAAGYSEFLKYRPADQEEKSYLFLTHTLAVNDVLIAAALLERQVPYLRLADMRHERVLKHAPVFVTTHEGKKVGVVPDAWLDFHLTASQGRMCVALELDRGTTEQKAMKQKLHALLAFAQGPYQQAFGTDSLTIAFATTAGEARAQKLNTWCEQVLTEAGKQDHASLFYITNLAQQFADPHVLFCTPVWQHPFAKERFALLEG